MRADVLPELRCPTSGSPLALDVATLPVRTVEAPYGAEIREGLLASVDGTMYPIVASVAILVPQPLTASPCEINVRTCLSVTRWHGSGLCSGTTSFRSRPHSSSGPLSRYTWLRRCRPAKNTTTLHALTHSFLNPAHVQGGTPRPPGNHVAGGLVPDDGGHGSGQPRSGELVQAVHGVLPHRQGMPLPAAPAARRGARPRRRD